ncbi:hypothetical protein [Halobacteriovorax sp. HLS]|uniref:hypothetical protein n=1 Tax=Halobacteriovorax sp. HLS TaxID=2234000 RepID=UPI000FD7B277|nr:hypothetical protein [Halobacteriovorax sp. HLS]
MKLKSLIICLSLLLSTNIYSQAITNTKYGDNDPTNLTDQDKDLSENFIHDGRVQRIYEEECTKDGETEEACLGEKADPKVLGMKSSMIGMLAKAYTMIIGMGGVGGELDSAVEEGAEEATKKGTEEAAKKGTEEAAKETAEDGAKEKTQKDYCKYIPVATEAIAMFNTTSDQKSIGMLPQSVETAQKDSLLKAAENHDSRAKTAQIQTAGWGVGTACYVSMMTFGGAAWGSWSNVLKLSASVLLTGFYANQVGAHKDYAQKTRDVANKLPGKGDCNPITDKTCFCTEETSKQRPDYVKYCRPDLHNRNILVTSERVTCIDENMKEDPACACAQRDTCVDKKVMTTIKGFGGTSFANSPLLGDFSQLSRGELTAKSLNNSNNTLNNAIAKLREYDSKVPKNNSNLNKRQKEEFNLLTKMGLPPNIAKKFATTPMTPEMKKNMANFNSATGSSSGIRRYSNSNSRKQNSSVLTFSGGDGINSEKPSKKSSSSDLLRRLGLNKKKKRKNSKTAVLNFPEGSDKALNQAQISNNKNRIIFDIISRRYQVSGWRRLEYIKD